MKIRRKLITSLLGAAMLALPLTAPAFAQLYSQPYYGSNSNSNYVQPVDWWWDHYKDNSHEYAYHGWHKGNYEYGGKRYQCERARGLESQVWRDRQTGHPAAAREVEREAEAARSRCYTH